MDVEQQINEVERRISDRVLEAGTARVTTVSQTYRATVEEVWDACTNPERIPRWFLPISGDLRLNGRYQLEGNAGGTITQCDPPRSFAATWEYGGEVSWIEVRVVPESPARTRLVLEHVAHVSDELWETFGPGAVGIGWDSALLGLAGHLGRMDGPEPGQAEEWLASAEGRRFLALSSERWREANVAAGTDEAVARAAADRVLAAYTGAA